MASASHALLPCLPSATGCEWDSNASKTMPACERDNLLTTLKFVNATLERVPWMLSYGTLLGSMRSGGHIPHETDIDVSVDVANWTAAVAQLTKAASAHAHIKVEVVKIRHRAIGVVRPMARVFYSASNRVHTDVWQYERRASCVDFLDQTKLRLFVHNSLIFPLGMCQYEDSEYPCPRDSLSVVATGYGADWRTPRRKYGPSTNWTDNLYHYNNEWSCHRSSHHI